MAGNFLVRACKRETIIFYSLSVNETN